MKKLLFFFFTLFVLLIPRVSADNSFDIDFRSTSTEPIFPNSINYINNTVCSGSSFCTGTYVETLEKTITSLENEGYSVFISLANSSDLFGGDFTFYLYVFDQSQTDLSNMVVFSESGTYNTGLDLRTSDNSPIYYWSFFSNSNSPFHNYDNILSEISSNSPSSIDRLPITTIFRYQEASYYFGSRYPYYLSDNISFTYDLDYSLNIFTDFTTNPNEPLTINSSSGVATNYLLYLRTYTSHDIFAPPEEPEPSPDNPNQGIEDGLGDINDSINSTDTSGAEDSFGGFFDNFEDNDYGLSDIIKTPLTFIQGLSTNTCSPITLPLPFVNQNLVLPCIRPIFQDHFSPLLTVYQLITFGLISYFIVINIFKTVRGFKNPDSNNVEVLEL